MKIYYLSAIAMQLILLLGVGCTHYDSDQYSSVAVEGDPNGTVPSYSQNLVRGWPKGRSLNKHDLSRVRYPEQVHAYHVGRLPADDRRSMREAHTVYRLEQSARWDQRLPATPMKSRGPLFGINEPSHRPMPHSDVISTEMMRQSAATRELMQSQERLRIMEQQLRDRLLTIQKARVEKVENTQKEKQLQREKANLENQLGEVKDRLKETEEKLLEARSKLMQAEDSKANNDAFDSF